MDKTLKKRRMDTGVHINSSINSKSLFELNVLFEFLKMNLVGDALMSYEFFFHCLSLLSLSPSKPKKRSPKIVLSVKPTKNKSKSPLISQAPKKTSQLPHSSDQTVRKISKP